MPQLHLELELHMQGRGRGFMEPPLFSLYQLKPTLALATHFLDHGEFIFPPDTLYAPDIS